MTDISTLQDTIERCEAEMARLEETHGTGVRPGWVGEELSMLWWRVCDARKQIEAASAAPQGL